MERKLETYYNPDGGGHYPVLSYWNDNNNSSDRHNNSSKSFYLCHVNYETDIIQSQRINELK